MKPHRQSCDDASDTSRELRALLGAFATYHRAPDERLPEGVSAVARDDAPRDARIFASRSTLEVDVRRWDADELGRRAVVHTWDLTNAAAARLEPALRDVAAAEERESEGIVVSNRGGYHSTPNLFARRRDDAPELAHLERLVRGVVAETEGERRAEPPEVTTSWVNVSRAGDSHGLHTHAGARWSGVYYVSVPEAACRGAEKDAEQGAEQGAEQAMLPADASLSGRLVLRLCAGGADASREESAREGWCAWTAPAPRPGRLVLFPSWMLHGVMPFDDTNRRGNTNEHEGSGDGDGEEARTLRIAIAFNTGEKGVDVDVKRRRRRGDDEDEGERDGSRRKVRSQDSNG